MGRFLVKRASQSFRTQSVSSAHQLRGAKLRYCNTGLFGHPIFPQNGMFAATRRRLLCRPGQFNLARYTRSRVAAPGMRRKVWLKSYTADHRFTAVEPITALAD